MPTIAPRTSEVDDEPLSPRVRAVVVPAGSSFSLSWPLRDGRGLPVDLTPLAPGGPPAFPPARLRAAEAVLRSSGAHEFEGTIADPAAGVVAFEVPPGRGLAAGVYEAEAAACRQSDGLPERLDAFTIYVEPSLFASSDGGGPPRVRDVRLRLRDSSPAESRLLDELQFDDAEIAHAVVRVVRHWNDTPPLLRPRDTTNFPFPDLWMVGIRATLFEIASDWYRKNRLTTTAGGVSLDDMDKAREFEAAAQRELEKWRADARSRKAAINIQGGFRSFGGYYSQAYGRGR